MEKIEKKFVDSFQEIENIKSARFLLLVSGGVDSMTLAYLFLKYFPKKFSILHINYNLRPESIKEQQLVEEFSRKYSLKYYFRSVSIPEHANIQLTARNIRYKEALKLQKTEDYNYIVTAHHQNDLIETFLFRLFRGTSIDGLVPMEIISPPFFRPLLQATKEEIITFSQDKKIPYLEDSSNFKSVYTRNKIRNELGPILKKYFPLYQEKIAYLIDDLKEVKKLIQEKISSIPLEEEKNKISFSKTIFSTLSSFLQREFLKFIYQKLTGSPMKIKRIHLDRATLFILSNQDGTYLFPNNLILYKSYDKIICSFKERGSQNIQKDNRIIELEIGKAIQLDSLSIKITLEKSEKFEDNFFSLEEITPPFYLKKRSGGEHVNRKSRKKLKVYLQKQKIPQDERNNLWLLLDSNRRVFWCEKVGFFHSCSPIDLPQKGYKIAIDIKEQKK